MMRDHYPSVLTELGDDPKEDQEVHNPVIKGNVVPQEGIRTSWVELSIGGAVSPSEVLPSSNPSGRVVGNAIGYPPLLLSSPIYQPCQYTQDKRSSSTSQCIPAVQR